MNELLSPTVKVALGATATIMSLASYVPYFRDIYRGKTKPHAFSWLIWAALTAIGYAGQVADKGGAGTWVMGVSALLCFAIFLCALHRGERSITRGDWYCLLFSALAIPLWLLTSTPLWSMVLITVIDGVGFFPTFRKSYYRPFEETLITYLVAAIKFLISILALDTFSVVTILYPASLVVMNGAFVIMLYWRRRTSNPQV